MRKVSSVVGLKLGRLVALVAQVAQVAQVERGVRDHIGTVLGNHSHALYDERRHTRSSASHRLISP